MIQMRISKIDQTKKQAKTNEKALANYGKMTYIICRVLIMQITRTYHVASFSILFVFACVNSSLA
ncbi:MAG TPA: hypothetical protein DHV48_19205 [Prolixibacteraceae bacterium]|nr:MAG: hypothetical protein A2066_17115 [Bacteroidetes bacterium GWB2_41_8]HCY43433.1 hypothetical protein [Prolixibacteraceae bacterium]